MYQKTEDGLGLEGCCLDCHPSFCSVLFFPWTWSADDLGAAIDSILSIVLFPRGWNVWMEEKRGTILITYLALSKRD